MYQCSHAFWNIQKTGLEYKEYACTVDLSNHKHAINYLIMIPYYYQT